MTIMGGTLIGPPPAASDGHFSMTNSIEGEASGRQAVNLSARGQYVQFTTPTGANTLVLRYCVPDTADGRGADYTLSLYLNGVFLQKIPVTSRYSWLYGVYPFSNRPSDGQPRNFFDEARLKGLVIHPNDVLRLQVDAGDSAAFYILDLIDLEAAAAPLSRPPNSRSVLDNGAVGDGFHDDTEAIRSTVSAGGIVWVPPGTFLISGDIAIPAGTTLQGAGLWHSTFIGDPAKYAGERGRIRFKGMGDNIRCADFAIIGRLNFRNDSQANDGFGESFGTHSTLTRLWIEHTKAGAWIANSKDLTLENCRIRNTLADGINLCVGVNRATVTNCTTRNTGDDGFAIWPATYLPATYEPGSNVITHCTAQLPFLANGSALYGGRDNRIEECLFRDIPYGAGILIAGTFPVGAYILRGHTTVQHCDVIRAGGYDFGWRGALTLRPHYITLNGITIDTVDISDSLSSAIQIASPGSGTLTNTVLRNVAISGNTTGIQVSHDAKGSATVSNLTVNGCPMQQAGVHGVNLTNASEGRFTFNLIAP